MKIGILQPNPVIGDIKGNSEKILSLSLPAFKKGAKLCVTPELSLTGYLPQDWLYSYHLTQKCDQALIGISKKIPPSCGLIVGFPQKNNQAQGRPLFNSACLVTRKGIEKIYSKKLLPTYDIFDEDRYFEPGIEDGFFEFNGMRFFLTICEDAWFQPKIDGKPRYHHNPFDHFKPCDLIINVSASPFYSEKHKTREKLFSKIALNHSTPFLFVNQTGGNDDLLFDGQSCLISGNGKTITRLKAFEEDVKILDLKDLKKQTPLKTPYLASENEIIKALICGVRDFVTKLKFQSVFIGLSGGIDSALTAVLAKEALGAKSVTGILMPSPYSSPGSVNDSLVLAKNLGIKTQMIPIHDLMRAYQLVLKKSFKNSAPNIAEENIQSRIRGNILMGLSNKFGGLVLTTSNKSELACGYGTIYGDMAGALCVLGDVYKTRVYDLSFWFNKNIANVIPKEILTKPPSAELKPNQADQDTLPPYDILDCILSQMIEGKKDTNEIIGEGYDKNTVSKVESLFRKSEFKRKQGPTILKITERAFGTGWKMPIVAQY